jgi:hypothetical protein
MIRKNKVVNSVTLNAKRKIDRAKPRCFQLIKKDDGRIELEGQTVCLFVYKDGEQQGVGGPVRRRGRRAETNQLESGLC